MEQATLDLLRTFWSVKNTFVPVDQIPREVLSRVPEHCEVASPSSPNTSVLLPPFSKHLRSLSTVSSLP